MLPTVMTAKRSLTAALAALSIAALPVAPAHAWGDKEQGFVAGVITTIIVDSLITKKKVAPAPAPAPVPVYTPPTTTYVTLSTTPAARAFKSYTLGERKAIQRNLKAWGYYAGSADGVFGRGTYNAVVAYAADMGVSDSLKSTAGAFSIYDGMIY